MPKAENLNLPVKQASAQSQVATGGVWESQLDGYCETALRSQEYTQFEPVTGDRVSVAVADMACAAFLSTCPSRFSSLGANHSINQVCFRYPRYRRRTRAGRSIHVQLQKEGMSERHYLPASPESRPAHHSVTAAIASAAATVTFMLPSQEAAAISPAAAVAGPLFAPLNAETPELLRALVWLDFRVAVALFVVSPLVLFLWSLVDNDSETDAVKRTLIGYWYG